MLFAALTLTGLALTLPVAEEDAPWWETRLENGVRVILVDAPLASEQVTVAIHPWGLLGDGAGQSQLSHLAEHVVVRSIDPDVVEPRVDGILLRGETMGTSLRLDTYAPAEQWLQSLDWHRRWATGSSLKGGEAEAMLERMKLELTQEIDLSLRAHFTQRWALAAWNQVVRHGANDVGLLEELDAVDAEQVLASVRQRIVPGDEMLLLSVGPVPRADLLAAVTERFGDLEPRRPRLPPPTVAPARILAAGRRSATWDLPMGHLLVWWPVPDESARDRVAVDALALLLNARIQQRGTLLQMGVQAVAAGDLITPEGRSMLMSASVPAGVDPLAVETVLDEIVASLAEQAEAPMVIRSMADQLADWPDFADLRSRFADQDGVEWIEAQQALFVLYAQLNMGLGHQAIVDAYRQLKPEDMLAVARALTPDRRASLLITPRG